MTLAFALTLTSLIALYAHVVLVASLLHSLLPPYEIFSDFPNLQKKYKLFLFIVQHVALNSRKQVVSLYPSLKDTLEVPDDAKR